MANLFSPVTYSLILADPPWHYNSRAHHSKTRFGGGVHNQYPTMKDQEILDLPVRFLAEKDALLFLWVTGPRLDLGMEVIKAWGFKYKTVGFTWLKTNRKSGTLFFGTGFYTKHNAEFCLLATRGKVFKPATDTVSSAILSPIEAHSKKPDTVQERIECMYPSLTKVELFARRKRSGWDSWGNEIESNIKLVS